MLNSKRYGGIDPGISGACAVVDSNSHIVDLYDYTDDASSLYAIFKRLSELDIVIYIEDVLFMSMQSFKNQFKYIATFYEYIFLMKLFGIKYKIISSRVWKKEFNLTKDKKLSFKLAQDIIDGSEAYLKTVSKHHNRAEAALIALYAERCENK